MLCLLDRLLDLKFGLLLCSISVGGVLRRVSNVRTGVAVKVGSGGAVGVKVAVARAVGVAGSGVSVDLSSKGMGVALGVADDGTDTCVTAKDSWALMLILG